MMGRVKELILIGIILLIDLPSVYAAPVGNRIHQPLTGDTKGGLLMEGSGKSITAGYIFDCVFDRSLDNNSGELKDFRGNFVTISYPVTTNMDFYGLLGLIEFRMKEKQPVVKEFETNQNLALGLGAWIHLFKTARNMSIDLDAKFRRSKGDVDFIVGPEGDVVYKDWQAAFVISRPYELFTPYFAIRYGNIEIGSVGDFGTQHSNYLWGTLVGLRLNRMEEIFMSIEARFVDELAMTAQFNYQF
ncbi:MAG: hypothetical protein AB1650_09300 [Candidatus Omnitrophota bacterium]